MLLKGTAIVFPSSHQSRLNHPSACVTVYRGLEWGVEREGGRVGWGL